MGKSPSINTFLPSSKVTMCSILRRDFSLFARLNIRKRIRTENLDFFGSDFSILAFSSKDNRVEGKYDLSVVVGASTLLLASQISNLFSKTVPPFVFPGRNLIPFERLKFSIKVFRSYSWEL